VSPIKRPTYTRSELAKLLDVSISTIRRLENKELFPKKDSNGVHRFDYAEVAELARRRAVPMSAESARAKQVRMETKAMALFDAGKDPVEVMRTLRATCEEAMGLWKFYKAARRNTYQ
jgi:DNA-binding XRE family transcriptional regulator